MAKDIIKRYMPNQDTVKEHKHLQFLGEKLHEPNLWHLNRRSVARAFAVGLFVAWLPIPGQIIVVALAALYFRANMVISVALVWLTNPITWVPLFYFAYRVGLRFLNMTPPTETFEFTMDNVMIHLDALWGPLLFGCLFIGTTFSVIGYFGIQYFWRWQVTQKWQHRKQAREKNQ
jgi:uncharacterized protein (DUF2062 family)